MYFYNLYKNTLFFDTRPLHKKLTNEREYDIKIELKFIKWRIKI